MSKLTTGIAIAGLLSPVGVQALGVGEIRLQSYLNQTLRAEIPLVLSQEKLSDLKIQLAPARDFAAAGLERSHILTKLRFEPAQKPDGGFVIRVGSNEVIHEPFLSFLVELTWPEGRMLRNFTVLLDPPDVLAQPSAPLRARRIPDNDERLSESGPVASSPIAATVDMAAAPGSEYGPVGRNEKLWAIAAKLNQYPDITQEQMVIALFRFNPGAFSRPSVNALNAGVMLRVPQREYILEISPSLAREEFFRQQAGRAPRWMRESATAAGPSDQGPESYAEYTGPRRTDAPVRAAQSVQSATGIPSDAGLRALEALRRENSEMRSRLAELEKRVAEMQVMFAEKEFLATRGQPQATFDNKTPNEGDTARAKGLVAQAPSPTSVPADAASPGSVPAPGTPVQPLAATNPTPANVTAPTASGQGPYPAESQTPATPATRSTSVIRPAEPVIRVQASSDRLEGDIGLWLLAGAGAALASLSGWIYRRRTRIGKAPIDQNPTETPLTARGNSPSEAVITSDADRIIQNKTSPPIAESEGVDPIFEADIYLSYGKHGQAIETIEHALREHPEREAYRLKLLEIHLVRGDTKRFDDEVENLKSGNLFPSPAFWDRVSELAGRLHAESSPDQSAGIPRLIPVVLEHQPDETDRLIDDLKRFSIEMRVDSPKAPMEAQTPPHANRHDQPEEIAEAPSDTHDIPWVPVIASTDPTVPPSEQTEATSLLSSIDEHSIQFAPESPNAETQPPTLEALASESIDSLLKELSALHYERQCRVDESAEAIAPSGHESEIRNMPPVVRPVAAGAPESTLDSPAGNPSIDENGDPSTDLETKLDLARAYADMGDHEQATEFLGEVMDRGSETQKAEATGLLATLAGAAAVRPPE